VSFGVGLQTHRVDAEWKCEICGRVIRGKRNTIHMGVISHVRAEHRQGLRKPNDGTYDCLKEIREKRKK
jgi:hypothetical protein